MDYRTRKKAPPVASVDFVYETIREKVFDWEYEPGFALSEQKISDELGVSRTPVREAFIRLVGEDFLEARPYRGTFVTQIDLNQVEEARFIRTCLEKEVVQIACGLDIPDFVAYAEDNIKRQKALVAQKDMPGFLRLDDRLHEELFAACGKTITWQVIQSVGSQYRRLRGLLMDKTTLPDEHTTIVDAIKYKDPAAAAEAMAGHLGNITGELVELRQLHPQFFKG